MKRILFVIIVATSIFPNGAEAGKASAIVKIVEEGGEAALNAVNTGERAAVKGEAKAAGKEAGKMHWATKNAAKATGRWIASNKETKSSKQCYDCGGDGTSYFRTCKTCNGSGYIQCMAE